MRNFAKRVLVLVLSAIMVFGMASTAFAAAEPSPSAVPQHVTAKNIKTGMGRVLNTNNKGIMAYVKTADQDKGKTYIALPDSLTVKAKGVNKDGKTETSSMSYKLTVVAANAFDKVSTLRCVKLGKFVNQVNSDAFVKNKNLARIIISGTGAIKFCKGAFNGHKDLSKITIVVNSKMSSANQKKLKQNLHALGFTNKLLASNVKFTTV